MLYNILGCAVVLNLELFQILLPILYFLGDSIGVGLDDLPAIYSYPLPSYPHFYQFQIHSFHLQLQKVSQIYTCFRPILDCI